MFAVRSARLVAMKYRCHIVDVFAEARYAGNPLAVVLGADDMPAETMQGIAAEMNFSETTFVQSAPATDGGYGVRLFTPAREIAFAGHPILGTAWVIRQAMASGAGSSMRLHLPVGPIAVEFETIPGGGEVAWFRAPAATAGACCDAPRIAAALGLAASDIAAGVPVQQWASGTAAMIVPLASLDALQRCRLDLAAFAPLAAEGFPPLVYVYCRETRDAANDLSARFFFEAHGVREDPATGNGAAFLGAHLLAHRVFSGDALSLRIEQGHAVRRPSLVRLRARKTVAGVEVHVGGTVVPTFSGELL